MTKKCVDIQIFPFSDKGWGVLLLYFIYARPYSEGNLIQRDSVKSGFSNIREKKITTVAGTAIRETGNMKAFR